MSTSLVKNRGGVNCGADSGGETDPLMSPPGEGREVHGCERGCQTRVVSSVSLVERYIQSSTEWRRVLGIHLRVSLIFGFNKDK